MSQSDSDIEKFVAEKTKAVSDALMKQLLNDAIASTNTVLRRHALHSSGTYPATPAAYLPAVPEPPVETYIGYVTAWRWWKAQDGPHDTIRLGSTGVDTFVWDWGENIAKDYMNSQNPTDEPITLENEVGFHAFKEDSIEHMGGDVFGRVALYGDVAVHKLGYRAEKARILDLWVHPGLWEKAKFIPKVRGTFTVEEIPDEHSIILDKEGNPFPKGHSQWVLFQHLNALKSGFPSDSPMTRLRLKSYPRPRRSQAFYPWTYPYPMTLPLIYAPMELRVMPDGKYENSCLYAAPYEKKIVKPEGQYCPTCGERIKDNEAVVVSYTYPNDDITQSVIEGTFQFTKETHHLTCDLHDTEIWHMGADIADGDDGSISLQGLQVA